MRLPRHWVKAPERFLVLGVNPRGVGLSDDPELDVQPVSQAAADAGAVIEGPVHVVGASLGAAAAIELALEQPERVRSLTLITPFVRANPRLLAVTDAWARIAAEGSPETLSRALRRIGPATTPYLWHLIEHDEDPPVRGLVRALLNVNDH